MFNVTPRLPALAVACGLAACSGPTAGGQALPPAAQSLAQALGQSARAAFPGIAPVRVFTSNRDGGNVLGFDISDSGDVSPAIDIAGPNTQLSDPDSLAIDAHGDLYAANDGGEEVFVFGKNAHGNVKPIRIIGGSKSHLGPTEGLFVDPKGDLWVSDYGNDAVTEYAPGAHGNVAPVDTISGNATHLDSPTGMAMNASG